MEFFTFVGFVTTCIAALCLLAGIYVAFCEWLRKLVNANLESKLKRAEGDILRYRMILARMGLDPDEVFNNFKE